MSLQEPNTSIFQTLKSFIQLKHLHARLFRCHLHQNQFLLNLVLKSAFHFKQLNYATAVFTHTHEPNFHLYGTMIRRLVSSDCFTQAIEFFHSMRREGFLLNDSIFPFVLKSCANNMDFSLGASVHSLVIKAGFDRDDFVQTGLVGFYSKLEGLEDAYKVFDDMPEKSVACWAAIMSGYIGARRFREAVDLFMRSLESGLRPDSYTLVRALSACIQLGDLGAGQFIHKYVTDIGMERNVFVNTSLVDMYAKCGNMEKACVIFDEMHERDIVTWGTMIQGYAANGHPKEALEMFHMMQRENLRPDCYVIVGVLSACASLGALELGARASSLMNKNDFLLNPVMGTALVDMYAKCGKMVAAWEVFKEMKTKDIVIYNAVISGLAMTGHVKAAFGCFALVHKTGFRADENTFLGLLCGCTHAGLVYEGRLFFSGMASSYSIAPTIEHYGSMVDLLARAGLLNEAYNMILSMPMKANSIVWGALLGGCRLHKDTQLAEHVLKILIELEPWNSGNYVLLSNIYSTNQKWAESEHIRTVMSTRGIQKVRGYSWIEIDGVVHEFLVGDTSHPMSDNIYGKLNELANDLGASGYVPTTEYVLFDIEEEEKQHFLGCHSEKLALAFGLIRSKDDSVIRIVKNLRVCGDCHTAIKLISKITGREIIVRDNNRFHHFVDGCCSCRDYCVRRPSDFSTNMEPNVQEHNHPHILLLQIGNTFCKLPGGRLKPGENEIEDLKRKLSSTLAANSPSLQPEWQIGECVASWWRPNFETIMYPYSSHITKPKECKKLYLVQKFCSTNKSDIIHHDVKTNNILLDGNYSVKVADFGHYFTDILTLGGPTLFRIFSQKMKLTESYLCPYAALDRWIWDPNKNGTHTVKLAYHLILSSSIWDFQSSVSSSRNGPDPVWNRLWQLRLPSKNHHLCSNSLPSRDNLLRRELRIIG